MKLTQRFAGLLLVCGVAACTQEKVAIQETPSMPARESTPIPATGLRMVAPEGWVEAQEFVGFLNMETRSSIMVTEMPGAFAEVSVGFKDKDVMAQAGMTLLTSEPLDQGLYPGLFLRISQEVYGTQVEKWGWVFGDGAQTVMVMGTCYEADDLPVVKASVESVEWDPQVKYEEPDGIGFEINPGKLVLAERMGKMLVYTSTGQLDPEKKGIPVFMLGPAMRSGPIADHKEFIELRARDFPFEYGETRSNEAVEIDGLPGYTLVASVVEESPRSSKAMHLTVLFEADNYWILMGTCDVKVEAEFLPVFDAAAQSFVRTR